VATITEVLVPGLITAGGRFWPGSLFGYPSGPLPVLHTFVVLRYMQHHSLTAMQVVLLVASNPNKFSFVFDCYFNICRFAWPWDTWLSSQEKTMQRELGQLSLLKHKLPISLLFSFPPASCESLFCPQPPMGSIHLFCWAFCVICLIKSSSKLVNIQVNQVHKHFMLAKPWEKWCV